MKDGTEFSDYQETYYRACSYEAIYMFEYVDRQKGVQMAHDIYHHARYNQGDSIGFEEAYQERAQLMAEHGGQGGPRRPKNALRVNCASPARYRCACCHTCSPVATTWTSMP